MRTLALLLLATQVVYAAPAEKKADTRSWHFGIEGMTDFPLSVGVQVWAELPYRLRLTMSAGDMPDAYLQTINSVAVSAGVYNQRQADFITELLDHAATWRVQVGWRPFPRRGGYIEAGFGILALDKGLALGPVITLATGFPVPAETNVGLGYELNTVVELMSVEVGWVWYPWRDLTVRLAFAFAGPVGAQVSIEPNFASTLQRPFTRFAENYGEQFIEKYLLIPTVGLAIGWRLF